MFYLERARNEEKINDGCSAIRQTVGGMVNNLCKIENILSKLILAK